MVKTHTHARPSLILLLLPAIIASSVIGFTASDATAQDAGEPDDPVEIIEAAEDVPDPTDAQHPALRGSAADEVAVPPAAFAMTLTDTFARSNVVAKVVTEGVWAGPIPVVIENRNPFPVAVYDLTLLLDAPGGEFAEYRTAEAVVLAPADTRKTSIHRTAIYNAGDTSPRFKALRAHRARFGLTMASEALTAFETRMGSQSAELSPFGVARSIFTTDTFFSTEREAAANVGYPLDLLDDQRSRVEALRATIGPMACASLTDTISEAGITGPVETTRSLAIYNAARSLIHETGADPLLTDCLTPASWAAMMWASMGAGDERAAIAIATRFERGPQTPAPFKGVLLDYALERYQQSITLVHEEDFKFDYSVRTALRQLHRVSSLDPTHPALTEREAISAGISRSTSALAERYDFDNAQVFLALQREELEALERSGSKEQRSRVAARYAHDRDSLAFTQATYLYHHRRHSADDRAQAHALFEASASHAPARAAMYRAGLLFVEYQFTSIFLALALLALMVLASRSKLALRGRMRVALWRARLAQKRGDHHHALERYWKVLSRMLGISAMVEGDKRLQAIAAAGVLDVAQVLGDAHEFQEARTFLGRITPELRPSRWQTPDALLDKALRATRLLGRRDATHTLLAELELIKHLFEGTAQARLAATLGDDALARVGGDASHHDYIRAIAGYDALAADEAGAPERVRTLARLHGGLLAATAGPQLEPPAEAWARAHAFLDDDDVEHTIRLAGDDDALFASLFARVVTQPLHAVIDELDEVDGERRPARFGEVLLEAARGARLPVPRFDQPTGRASLEGCLLALARLDNLLTRHLDDDEDALDARLRVAVLRRIGAAATGMHTLDAEYTDDCADLFAKAAHHHDRPTTVALAAVLDLLTEGDFGFDRYVEAATGGDRTLYTLLSALDAYAHDRPAEALGLMASADPDDAQDAARAARLHAARATLAASVGQDRAACGALRRALDAGPEQEVVHRVAARLLPLTVLEGEADLIEAGVRGLLNEPRLATVELKWRDLGATLAAAGKIDTAMLALERSAELEGAQEDVAQRAAVYQHLCRLAVRARDCTLALRCAILARVPERASGYDPLGQGTRC